MRARAWVVQQGPDFMFLAALAGACSSLGAAGAPPNSVSAWGWAGQPWFLQKGVVHALVLR